MRVAIASIMHEGNTFAPTRTELSDFDMRERAALARAFRGTNTELGGFLQAAEAAGVEVVPVLSAAAMPGGIVTAAAFEQLRDRLVEGLRAAGRCDGVLLALHGALVAEAHDSGDADLLAAVRGLIGPDLPLFITLDMHANVTARIVASADAIVGYDLLPHTDAGDKGEQVARLLFARLRGELRPAMAWRKLPLITTPENGHTLFGPMAELVAEAKALERRPGVLSASLFPVQAWLDVPEQGWSTLVMTDNAPALADEVAEELARRVWARRHDFSVELLPVAEAIRRALALREGPAVFANSADNTGGGAPGDNTALLAGLLDAYRRQDGSIGGEDVPALLTLVDPAAVAAAIEAGVGGRVSLDIGGKLDHVYSRPVPLTAYVKTITDGRYTYRGTSFTGMEVSLGRTVVLVCGGIHLLVSERKGMTIDPAMYRSAGLEPAQARIVAVKTASGFRSGYADIARAVYVLDTPGYCPPNLRSLPFRRVPRPIFPLDDL